MKILIFSDSHGAAEALVRAVAVTGPDLIVHLGDGLRDCGLILERFPQIPLRRVRGNCDFGSVELAEDEFVAEGKRFFATHGHRYSVKSGLTAVVEAAQHRGADVLLFGHTHRPVAERRERLLVINPGSIGSAPHPYGVVTVEHGKLSYDAHILGRI